MRDAFGQPVRQSETATLRALAAERRRPDAADAPPPTPFPGRKAEPLPGQLTLTPEPPPEAA